MIYYVYYLMSPSSVGFGQADVSARPWVGVICLRAWHQQLRAV